MRMLAKDPADRPASAGALGREALSLAPTLQLVPAEATRVLPVAGAAAAAGVAGAAGAGVAAHAAAARGRRRPRAPDTRTRDDHRRHPARPRHRSRLPSPAASQLPSWLPYAVALVVLAVLLLLVAQACGNNDADPAAGTGDAAQTASEAAGVAVDAADLRGPAGRRGAGGPGGLGLRVAVDRTVGGGEVGTVKAVSPTGSVPPGSLVTLEAVAAPPPQDDDGADEDDERKGNGKSKGKDKDKGRGNDPGDEGDD